MRWCGVCVDVCACKSKKRYVNIIIACTPTKLTVNDPLDAALHLLVNVDLRAAGSKDVVVAATKCFL